MDVENKTEQITVLFALEILSLKSNRIRARGAITLAHTLRHNNDITKNYNDTIYIYNINVHYNNYISNHTLGDNTMDQNFIMIVQQQQNIIIYIQNVYYILLDLVY